MKKPLPNFATQQFFDRLDGDRELKRKILGDSATTAQLISGWRTAKASPSIAKIDEMLAKMSCKLAIVPIGYNPDLGHRQFQTLEDRIARLESLLRLAQEKLRSYADVRTKP